MTGGEGNFYDHQWEISSFCSWDALSKLMGLGRCKLMGHSPQALGHTFSKSISICFISPAKVLLKANNYMGDGSHGFSYHFWLRRKPHVPPALLLIVDPVLNTGLLWITSVGMAGAGSCLKCLKFRGGHHGETNKNIKKIRKCDCSSGKIPSQDSSFILIENTPAMSRISTK